MGDDPRSADASVADASEAASADAVARDIRTGEVAGSRRGGKSAKARKRRRRRRGPVYAPGARPGAISASAILVAPAAEVASPIVAAVAAPADTRGPLYAALDLGTNNCRLLIAAPRGRGFRVVDAFSRIVRLGEGVGANGRLTEAAMSRAIEALKVCAGKLADRNVTRARLIATEACRVAANGREFVERVRVETGLALEVVSQETEARLAVAGCSTLIDPTASGVILFDIGGGSSELVWIDLALSGAGQRRLSDHLRTWMSLPVGVVNLSERHGGGYQAAREFAAMVGEVEAMLVAFPEGAALDRAVGGGRVHMLGTSGTVTTLAGVHLKLPRYDRRRVDGTWLTGGEVADLVAAVVAMNHAERVANPCIGRERADLVLAGCAILEAIRRRWPCERLRVADRGLREGMLIELMAADGALPSSGRRPGDRFDA